MNINSTHIYWFIGGLVLSFLVPAVFGNNKNIPIDWYYLIYFLVIGGFLFAYVKINNIEIMRFLNKNLVITLVLTLLFSFIMVKNVLSMPTTAQLTGSYLTWSVFWRGLMYGVVDGFLLSVFPFLVVWNTFELADKSLIAKLPYGPIAFLFVIIVTSLYHLGYNDFRSKKVIKANVGNVLISTPLVFTSNPISAPIIHASMHISAILHSPQTELFLPPHR